MKKNYEAFGNRIREIRKARKLTQVELADAIEVSGQFVSNCERGLCPLPKKNLTTMVKKLQLTQNERTFLLLSIQVDSVERADRTFRKCLGLQ